MKKLKQLLSLQIQNF